MSSASQCISSEDVDKRSAHFVCAAVGGKGGPGGVGLLELGAVCDPWRMAARVVEATESVLVRGWNGPRYVAGVRAPAGWSVIVWWHSGHESFGVRVLADGAERAVYSVGGEDEAELFTLEDLVKACEVWDRAPFGWGGCVDWDSEPGLLRALVSVSGGGDPDSVLPSGKGWRGRR